jgi:hypothetical protein
VLLISLQQCDFTDSRTKSQWGGLSPSSSGLDCGEKNMTCLGYPGVDLKDNQGDKQSALVSAIPYIRVSSISFSQNIVAW